MEDSRGSNDTPTHVDITTKQAAFPEVKVTIKDLYRYANGMDLMILAISSLCAFGAGVCRVVPSIIFSRIAYIFVQVDNDGPESSRSVSAWTASIDHFTLYFVYIAIASFVTQYISRLGFVYTGEKLARKIKEHFFSATLKQNIAIFDELGAGSFTTQISTGTTLVQDAISQKLGLTVSAFGTLLSTYILCFAYSWRLTLILLWCAVFAFSLFLIGKRLSSGYASQSLEETSAGNTIIEEAIGSIKSVAALGIQNSVIKRYREHLQRARASSFRLKAMIGCVLGIAIGTGYLNMALAFWQGSRFLTDGTATFVDVLVVATAAKTAAFAVFGVGSNADSIISALASASRLFTMIARESTIDATSEHGLRPQISRGQIEFRGVSHIYPSRPHVLVINQLDIVFRPGQITVVVGKTGQGKSSISHLIERFYDPVEGQVLFDGQGIQTLNVRWLRSQIRLVGQEPILFNTTITDNIAYGLGSPTLGSDACSPEKRQQIIEDAAKAACAHDFISRLPSGYETLVGERGSQLSGGQKQRIAIARALVANPRVLILDEATSALDSETEAKVQAAIRQICKECTIIMIAHRLASIRESDNVVVISGGKVVEQGLCRELLRKDGLYRRLMETQTTEPAQHPDGRSTVECISGTERESLLGKEHEAEGLASQTGHDIQAYVRRSQNSARGNEKTQASDGSLRDLATFLTRFNKSDLVVVLLGLFCSFIAGLEEPASAIVFGEAVIAISEPLQQSIRTRAGFWSLMYLMLALVQTAAFCIESITFVHSAESLIFRVRTQVTEAILHQDMEFYDQQGNSAGNLVSFVSTETSHLAGLGGSIIGTILISLTTLVSSLALACAFGWKLALVCFAVVPLIIVCGFWGIRIVGEHQARTERHNLAAAGFASETISGIRTIASLTREDAAITHFKKLLAIAKQKNLRLNLVSSLLYAIAQSVFYACMALGFWFGGTLIVRREYNTLQFIVVYSSILLGAMSVGIVFSFAPDIGKAKKSSNNIRTLLKKRTKIESRTGDGLGPIITDGAVEFRDVTFEYPTRSGHPVLRGVSFKVLPGQHIALVGKTGCGKSTIISLLEQFYDPTSGQIFVDGYPISSMNTKKYRRSLALVVQEPTLLNGTIRENLLAGIEDEVVSEATIEAVCKTADIYDFISSLPDGFATNVGSRGGKLSGGQKQRVALARALLRNPKILLLDEATSAVDGESEQKIQNAIERATEGCTSITIAHRLSTIRKADVIIVLDEGAIIEFGSHEELLARKGKYHSLHSASSRQ
ncbi:multidrug resistance protein 2 [Aureobasidium pullulans EXF-150]|uniref:Multidrug resistance protein 2 n=1 Tax=Aureobasidium pullulans EXF-150 TaxID=1043002 RepID=A0A074WYV3_AURPU|nr:multidrug resistance protein 2 [Aureobasidium pullulans EXF-150]KEQ78400.1 multidrug resistance protein 2 [Aureobasidium pullulans EXF-150]